MSAVSTDINIDQGADWATQIYVTDGSNNAMHVVGPMRMEIKNEVGGTAITLQTNETSEDLTDEADNQSILYNTESGLIQLYISGEDTDTLGPGDYSYDLFIHYSDNRLQFSQANTQVIGQLGSKVRKRKLLSGTVHVSGRVTSSI